LLTSFEVVYHFRPYVRRPDSATADPNLQGLRGTAVTLVAHTNRNVKEGRLLIDGEQAAIPAELLPDQPDALRFRLVLGRGGKYHIRSQSGEGEENAEPIPYTIQAEPDGPPKVELTKPGKNIVPADAILPVEGTASDDVGLTSVTLKMQVGKQELAAKLYR